MTQPKRIILDKPQEFLAWLGESPDQVSLDHMGLAQVWGLVGLGALTLSGRERPLSVVMSGTSNAARFAHALGLGELSGGSSPTMPLEADRSVRLRCIKKFSAIEPTSRRISELLVPRKDEAAIATRRTVSYVIIELLRNVIQHSRDPLGGVVAAQLMKPSPSAPEQRPMIQVAVADAGDGIQAALSAQHKTIATAEEALEKALWPHWSGTFAEGLSGSIQNAGMGLFFIAEMAKLTAGRLLIASRGASLLLKGDKDAREEKHQLTFLQPSGVGYPGTLVAFELPSDELRDYDALMATIVERAKQRAPRRAVHQWLRYDSPPPETKRFLVSVASEDTIAAERFSEDSLQPVLLERTSIALNFVNMHVCTQSFLHALLFEALRLAWARRVPIYIEEATPAVKSGLELLEAYALGG